MNVTEKLYQLGGQVRHALVDAVVTSRKPWTLGPVPYAVVGACSVTAVLVLTNATDAGWWGKAAAVGALVGAAVYVGAAIGWHRAVRREAGQDGRR